MRDIKVSIIVPVYNIEKYIRESVESILGQRLVEIELILVDDCSTDKSGAICDEYAKKDSRVQVIHKGNREGAANARNAGIRMARGEFVGFVDADDMIDEGMYEFLYDTAMEQKADMVCCDYIYWYENKKKEINLSENLLVLSPKEALIKLHERKGVYPYLWNKIIKKNILKPEDNDEEIIIGEDYNMVLEALKHSHKIVHVGRVLYYYRQRKNSVCNIGFSDKYKRVLENYKTICNLYSKDYPQDKNVFVLYCYVEELAVLSAMAKNNTFDNDIIKIVKMDIDKYLCYALKSDCISIEFKVSAVCVTISVRLFMGLMKIYFKIKNKTNILFE